MVAVPADHPRGRDRWLEHELARYARIAQRGIEDELRRVTASSFLTEPLRDYPSRGGKGLRPALLIATCQAFGGLLADALPAAIAIELLHNAFVVHDDIQDGSEMRRGVPCLHRRFGVAQAINAGDALALHAIGVLRANRENLGPDLAARVYDEFDFMARHTADGQAIDIGWRETNHLDATPGEYLDLIMKKTSWYTTVLPLRVGALIGSRGKADLKPLVEFGLYLGAAFQIQDDVLNITENLAAYGKERFGDLREGKRTLSLLHAYRSSSMTERAWLRAMVEPARERTEDDVAAIHRFMHRKGSIAFARAFAEGVAASAHGAFESAFSGVPDGPPRRFVETLIDYMIRRER